MGGDGGSLNNSRMELVRVRKEMMGSKGATSAVEKSVTERDKWTTCAVSRERLATPVVACRLGYLYNKDALIRLLLDKLRKKRMPEFAHVRSLKDVVECKLELSKSPDSVFKCPVTLKEATGGVHFVVIWGCGHVLSQQAVEELKGKKQSSKCVVCGADTVEIILLHPDDATRSELRAALDAKNPRKRKERSEKEDTKPDRPKAAVKVSKKESDPSSVYASLFINGNDHAHRSNERGSFTGVSLRPSGV